MKRVDFDPKGDAQPEEPRRLGLRAHQLGRGARHRRRRNQALQDPVRPGRDHVANHGSHHTWGNLGYYISSAFKFFNAIGHTKVVHNPDSWEGWYWGAMHHYGYSMRLGQTETYSTVEDLMKEAELVVFWSADPEATSGSYSAYEGTIRRQWLHELGIEVVHIDPYYNHTAALLGGKWFAPKPGTDAAMALAIAHVWITEGLYDKKFVAERSRRLRGVARLHPGQGRRRSEDARVAGAGNRHSGEGRARARQEVGDEEDLPRRRAAGATATAARAARRPASSGRARSPACLPCRAWGGPA